MNSSANHEAATPAAAWHAKLGQSAGRHPRLRWLYDTVDADAASDRLPDIVMAFALYAADAAPDPSTLESPTLQRLFLHTVMARRRRGAAESISALEATLWQARSDGDPLVLAWALAEQGRNVGSFGLHEQAHDDLIEAIDIASYHGARFVEAVARCNLGMLYAVRGRPVPYEQHTRMALDISRQIGDVHGVAHCMCNLAGALVSQDRHDEAEEIYLESRRIAGDDAPAAVRSMILSGLSSVYFQRGSLDEATRLALQAIRIMADDNAMYEAATATIHLATGLQKNSLHIRALKMVERAIAMATEHGMHAVARSAMQAGASIHAELGQYREAWQYLSQYVESMEHATEVRLESERRGIASARSLTRNAVQPSSGQNDLEFAIARANELELQLADVRHAQQEWRRLSVTDELTGLLNRRGIEDTISAGGPSDDGTPLLDQVPEVMLIFDADRFKKINDVHGHDVGDVALKHIGRVIAETVRSGDIAGRWGGEEFVVLMRASAPDAVIRVAERIRLRVAEIPVQVGNITLEITLSGGGAFRHPGEMPRDWFRRADSALYKAKRDGRNRFILADR